MKFSQNRIYAFFLGIITSITGWLGLMLMIQDTKKLKIEKDQCIGLGFAIVTYILWWFKFSYTVEAK